MRHSAALPQDSLGNVAVYNPDLLSKEELVAYFVARRPLLTRMLEDIGRAGSAQHHLLIGTRGMGKTTLLKRIRYAVEDDPELSAKWFPLTFPEEQYNVGTLSDLYLNCVDALSDALEAHGKLAEAKDLDAKVGAISELEEGARSREALGLLLNGAERLGKGFVLLLDNIDILLDRIKDQSWAFRELLSKEDRLLVIGASASHPEETYSYGASFYDFFKVHELRGLPEKEAREMMLHLSDARGTSHVRQVIERDRARLRTLHTLSGGNPRTLVLLYFLLSQSAEGNARTDLERLLDQITPLYKAKIEVLAPQAQKVLDAVAAHWHPVTAAQAAERARMDVGAVSSQLTRLLKEGIVEKTATPSGTKTAYQVAERLLNIWYLMRQSRRLKQRLVWLVEFLRMFYGHQELPEEARGHLWRRTSHDEDWKRVRHAEYGFALAEALGKGPLSRALTSASVREMVQTSGVRKRLEELLDLEGEDSEFKPMVHKHREAVELREKVLGTKVDNWGWNAQTFADLLGSSLRLSLEQKQGCAELLESLDGELIEGLEAMLQAEVQQWYRGLRASDLVDGVLRALRDGYMQAHNDVEGAYEAAEVFRLPALPLIPIVFKLKKEFREALLQQALKLSNESGGCAWGWNEIGVLLNTRQRDVEAESAFRKAIAIDPEYAAPWHNLGAVLHKGFKRDAEAEDAFRMAVQLAPTVYRFWADFAWNLYVSNRADSEAEDAARRAVELNPNAIDATHILACILLRRGKWEEAFGLLKRFILEADPDCLERPWTSILRLFGECVRAGKTAEAIALLDYIGYGERWLPLRAALLAFIEGRSSLLAIAPELRAPAEGILTELEALGHSMPEKAPKSGSKVKAK